MINEKKHRRKGISKSCNYDSAWGSSQRYGWSSLKAAVNHLWIPKTSQLFNNHYWFSSGLSNYKACLFTCNKTNTAVLDVVLLIRSSDPAKDLTYLLRSTLTWSTLTDKHIIGLKRWKVKKENIYDVNLKRQLLKITLVMNVAFIKSPSLKTWLSNWALNMPCVPLNLSLWLYIDIMSMAIV